MACKVSSWEEGKGMRKTRGFLVVSLPDMVPALTRLAQRWVKRKGVVQVKGDLMVGQGWTNLIFRLRYMVERNTAYMETREQVRENVKINRYWQEHAGDGNPCERWNENKDTWFVEMWSQQKYIMKEGGRNGLRDSAAGHVLMDMTLCVTVTKGAEANAALGKQGNGLELLGA
jgi:hypothetical protein